MRKTNTQKGITLIALIITIVVLLILAVVAINAVTGDGIIQHATNAKTEYENAQAKEESTLSYYSTYLDAKGQVGKWIQNKTSISKLNEDGTVDKLEVGDYVNYVSNKNTTIKWRVLGVDSGKLLLVSEVNVVNDYTLTGADDYINDTGITKLNNQVSGYDNGIGAVVNSARSINIEDINRVTGYNPNKALFEANTLSQYGNEVKFTLSDGKVVYDSKITGVKTSTNTNFEMPDGTVLSTENGQNKRKEIIIKNNYYYYYPNTLTTNGSLTEGEKEQGISKDSKGYATLFSNTTLGTGSYWLASKYVLAVTGGANFGMLAVAEGRTGSIELVDSTGKVGSNVYFGIRAVVTLKSDVTLTKVNGIWEISI